MSDTNITIMRMLFEASCLLEGMRAENAMRHHRNEAPAYVEDEFIRLSQETERRIREIVLRQQRS